MILHLSPGSGSIELHIHDDAQVALYQPGDRPALVEGSRATFFRQPSRLAVGAVIGTLCLALGYFVAPRDSAAPARFAGPVAIARPMAPLPSNLPLVPEAAPQPRYEAPGPVLPPTRPRAEAEPANGLPPALVQQLAQPPVVVPPAAPDRPSAGSSAFGLEN